MSRKLLEVGAADSDGMAGLTMSDSFGLLELVSLMISVPALVAWSAEQAVNTNNAAIIVKVALRRIIRVSPR
jgi:hypothetical protein